MPRDAGSLDRYWRESLHHQSGAQHGDPVVVAGVRGQHRRVGIGCTGHHEQILWHAKIPGLIDCDASQHGTAWLHLRQGRTPGLISDAALPGGLLKVPSKLEVVALFAPLPVLQEPTADPVGLMSQAINVAMVVQQLQGSRQAAAAAGCRAAIWHQPFECTGLLGERGGVAQCRPHGGAILPTSQKRA